MDEKQVPKINEKKRKEYLSMQHILLKFYEGVELLMDHMAKFHPDLFRKINKRIEK